MHKLHPFRIFWFSGLVTIVSLLGVYLGLGWSGLFIALILIVVEITFSFDNAILNARILSRLSPIWHTLFLTVGIIIAIFGVRLVLPIVIVMITAGLDWNTVIYQVINEPETYGHELEAAYPEIASFGGAFLLMLALNFLLDKERRLLWFKGFEKWLQRFATFWAPALVTLVVVGVISLLNPIELQLKVAIAGAAGVGLYTAIHILIRFFEFLKDRAVGEQPLTANGKKRQRSTTKIHTGFAAFTSFIYLIIIDSSFSFDSIIGAFAITTSIVLIAVGLGIGAFWVRSLTIYIVRRKTLNTYRYLEHGAHYTVFALAAVMFLGIFWHVPEVIAGLVGIGIISASIITSIEANRRDKKAKR